jgi:hypothetical protein
MLPNYQTTFGTRKEFKRLFKTCSYSNENFEPYDTKTVEHIIPKIRGGDPYDIRNRIIVKRSWNCLRSDENLGKFIEKYPQVEENIVRTVNSLEGVIIDGIEWAKEVKETFFKEIGRDIFKK